MGKFSKPREIPFTRVNSFQQLLHGAQRMIMRAPECYIRAIAAAAARLCIVAKVARRESNAIFIADGFEIRMMGHTLYIYEFFSFSDFGD